MISLFITSLFIGVPICIYLGINFIIIMVIIIYTPLLFVLATVVIIILSIAAWIFFILFAISPWVILAWLLFPPDKIFFVWFILLISGIIFEYGILPTLDEEKS